MEDVVFEVRPGRRLHLSISVGAAIYPHDGETYEALLATGDARMYRDKTTRKQLTRPAGARMKDRTASGLKHPAMPPDVSDIEIERRTRRVLYGAVIATVRDARRADASHPSPATRSRWCSVRLRRRPGGDGRSAR